MNANLLMGPKLHKFMQKWPKKVEKEKSNTKPKIFSKSQNTIDVLHMYDNDDRNVMETKQQCGNLNEGYPKCYFHFVSISIFTLKIIQQSRFCCSISEIDAFAFLPIPAIKKYRAFFIS